MATRSLSGSTLGGTKYNNLSYATQVVSTTATISDISGYRVYTFTADGSLRTVSVPKSLPKTLTGWTEG